MAAKKKKKTKASKPAKAKKSKKAPAKKSKAKKAPARKAKKPAKKTVKAAVKKAPAKKAKAKKAPAKKKKQIVGEGDYAASKSFLKDQSGFVEKNKAKIPAMGHEAEKALDGPEGEDLEQARCETGERGQT